MSTNRAVYFAALGIGTPPSEVRPADVAKETKATALVSKREARLAALTRSHEIRQFEIELYWKRATYFWVLQAAVFTALGLMWKTGGSDGTFIPHIVPVALAALGLLTAAAGWFSAQGSKFWQENWERHIDMLEDEFEGKLHKTAWIGLMGVRWSVSNINDRLILFFVIFWLLVFVIVCDSAVPVWTCAFAPSLAKGDFNQPLVLVVVLTTVRGLFSLYRQKSNLRGAKPDWTPEPLLNEVQSGRPRLLRKLHDAPFIVKRGQSE